MEFNGKVALVTGAAQGIGKSYGDHLLLHGVKVVISDVNKTVGEETRKEMAAKYGEQNVRFLHCDVTNDTQFEETIKETIRVFGQLDVLINNAGIVTERLLEWKQTINVNFISLVHGTHLGMEYMGKHKGKQGGTIVNIGSLTTFTPFECAPIYSATKSAVNQFSRSIGTKLHYDRTGVRVISVNPGLTDTPILKEASDQVPEEMKDSFNKNVSGAHIQSVENMGKGMIEVLKKAETGSLWVIEFDTPPKRIDFILEKYDH